MRAPELLARLEDVYRAEKTSFIRYVVEDSQAELRDDVDRRVFARYGDWDRERARSEEAARELLEEEGVVPAEAAYPIEFSQFNYLSPTYLLCHVIPRMEAHLRLLEESAAALEGWPRARDLVHATAERERIHLGEVKKLDAERPREPPAPPTRKGTSASRW
jgi:hypothetical protein